MKKLCISLFASFICLVFASISLAQSSPKPDWTIDQYFKILPAKYLPILDNYKKRESIVKEVDYENKYILLAHEEWKGWGEMVVFEKKAGGQIVAVTQYDCTKKYPSYPYFYRSQCRGKVSFLELSENQLVEVNDALPDVKKLMLYGFYEKKTDRLASSDDKLIFELPRERKDILIKLAGEALYSLLWNGEKFEGKYVD